MEINIIGAGLYGCLSAFKIKKKFPNYVVNLIDSSDHVISAFDPIKMGKSLYNNGFHGIELPRSKNLSDFFESFLNIDLIEKKNIKKLLLDGELVDYTSPLSEYPQSIKNFYKKVPTRSFEKFEEFYNCISDEFKDILKKISTRYSDNIYDVQHLILPWFFPIEYDIISNDEGDKFRTKVRSGQIVPTYKWPKGMLLSKIQEPFHESLKSLGVNIYLNSKVFFEDFGAIVSNSNFVGKSTKTFSKDDIVVSCIAPISLLKKISLNTYNDLTKCSKVLINAVIKVKSKSSQAFTEILCADTEFCELSRISKPLTEEGIKDRGQKKEYFQLEIITDNNWNKDYFLKKINDFFSKTTKIKGYELEKVIEIKETRKVFFPSKTSLELAQNHIEIWSKKFPNYKILKAFGPINMSKTWLYSEEVVDFIDKI